jgi:hypothetical protein
LALLFNCHEIADALTGREHGEGKCYLRNKKLELVLCPTYHYVRHGTTTLLAALDIATGTAPTLPPFRTDSHSRFHLLLISA